jgi:hypothetical protein
MNAWKSENLKLNSGEKDFMKITSFLFPKLPGIEKNVGKAFNLYRFLVAHLHTPAHMVVDKITENGKPLFTESNIAEMQAVIMTHKDMPYFKHITGSTAATTTATTATAFDPTRSKFWDKLIRKMTHDIGGFVPELCKNWDFYIFFLYSLEQFEMIGPFVSMALDSVTLSLPVMSDIASTGIESLFMLLPIPYASLVGEVAGYIIGSLFLLFAIMLNMNRRHFGSAFKVSLELIPMFGDILAEAATNFEVAMERAMSSRERMLKSLKTLSPTAYDAADYYVPSVNIKSGTPPDIFSRNTYNTIAGELENYATHRIPIPKEKLEKIKKVSSNVLNIVPVAVNTVKSLATNGLSGVLESAVSSRAASAVNSAVGNATSRVAGAVNSAVGNATSRVAGAVNSAVGNATSRAASAVNSAVSNATSRASKLKQDGGRRRRTRKRRV